MPGGGAAGVPRRALLDALDDVPAEVGFHEAGLADVYGTRVTPEGTVLGTPFLIASGPGGEGFPRVAFDGSNPIVLANFDAVPGFPLWNAMRWGNGLGGWRRDTLYVTNRSRVLAVSVGVRGRPSPTTLLE